MKQIRATLDPIFFELVKGLIAQVNERQEEELGYWDNTDWPDDVTDEEWAYREKSWSKLTDHDLAPASIGLSIANKDSLAYSLWELGLDN